MDGTPIHRCSITKFQEIYKSVSINVGKNIYNYLRKKRLNGTVATICSIRLKMSNFRGSFYNFLKNLNIPTLFFLTIFQSGNSKHIISGFFSAHKKDYLEESKNGHFKNVQKCPK